MPLLVNGLPFTVVGIWQPAFTETAIGDPFELTIPFATHPEVMGGARLARALRAEC